MLIPFVLLAVGCASVIILWSFWSFWSFRRVRKDFADSVAKALGKDCPRTWIVGAMMGSGKTTCARQLASRLSISHIEIDHYSTEDDMIAAIAAAEAGWVAEANPWQIPAAISKQAAAVLFLDFDNVVNYIRLCKRGFAEWKGAGFTLRNFKHYMIDRTVLDLGRIVFRYGRANRSGWRNNGILKEMSASATYIRCVSPAELEILIDAVAGKNQSVKSA